MRAKLWAWMLLVVVLGALLAFGATSKPTSGSSEDRLFALAEQMRCLACAGESVSNSQAPLAVEMRGLIGRQMRSGKTDDEILTYFADRYGERVLLRPAKRGLTALVWIAPVVVAAAAVAGLGLVFGRARRGEAESTDVTDADRELVRRVMAERSEGST